MKKNWNKCPFCYIFDKKGKNKGLKALPAAIFGGIFAPKYEL